MYGICKNKTFAISIKSLRLVQFILILTLTTDLSTSFVSSVSGLCERLMEASGASSSGDTSAMEL